MLAPACPTKSTMCLATLMYLTLRVTKLIIACSDVIFFFTENIERSQGAFCYNDIVLRRCGNRRETHYILTAIVPSKPRITAQRCPTQFKAVIMGI